MILGSKSPRRKEILSYFSIPFQQVDPGFDEDTVPFEGDPIKYATEVAKGKGTALAMRYPDEVILTADTIVMCNGNLYEKPKNEREGFSILKELSGKWHGVHTGLVVTEEKKQRSHVEITKVLFNDLTDEKIRLYQKALHCADKAGGYAIQQAGSLIVKKIDGCFYNAMGMPIFALQSLLLPSGIDLWHHLEP